MAYATVEQYVARYGAVDDESMLSECLEDASAAIDATLKRAAKNPADVADDVLMRVCRSVANRIVPVSSVSGDGWDVPVGVTQVSTTAGPYTQTYSRPAAFGTARLNSDELALLGISTSRIGWAPLSGGSDD